MPVVMFTAQGTVKTAVEAMRRGAMDFLEKPFTREQLHTVLARLETLQPDEPEHRAAGAGSEGDQVPKPGAAAGFHTPVMREVMDVLLRAAKTPASILHHGRKRDGQERRGPGHPRAKPSGGQAISSR